MKDNWKKQGVPEILKEAAKTFEGRNELYGDNWLKHGEIMNVLFPDGLAVKGVDDFNRLGVFIQVVSKFTRVAENFPKGGHVDSAHDLAVYSAMLEFLDNLNDQETKD